MSNFTAALLRDIDDGRRTTDDGRHDGNHHHHYEVRRQEYHGVPVTSDRGGVELTGDKGVKGGRKRWLNVIFHPSPSDVNRRRAGD